MTLLLFIGAGTKLNTEWVSVDTFLFQIAIVLFLVLLNGFFVASEFAIVKARGSQIDALLNQGVKGARLAREVTTHLDAYLSATQLGITLSSLGLGWVGEPFLANMLHPLFFALGITSPALISTISFTIAFMIITFLHIVLGELTPKSLAIRRPVVTTLWVARPLRLFFILFKPAIAFLNGMANWVLKVGFNIDPVAETELVHSEEELRLILGESQKAKAVSSLGSAISIRALALRHRLAREIMTPRQDVTYLNLEDTFEESLEVAKKSRHTRFPLCAGHLDHSIGLIHIKDVVAIKDEESPDLNSVARELITVPEMMSLEKLLDLFLVKHAHLALVVDEYGGAVGIVTLDNVIEELVGEIQDEFDTEQPDFERLSDEEFTVRGDFALHDLPELADLNLQSPDVSTIGGYVTHRLGHLPKAGESLEIDHYRVTVTQADGRRVKQLHFRRMERPATAGDDGADEG
ncbi:MAG TPA: hemolysin family protein [Chthoniobacteraceae bacterium]|nr:hemolysin family protein [Chthoniobacteraceae bacterium]